jgi:hypothetical protein
VLPDRFENVIVYTLFQAVNLPPNKVGTGWSQKYLQVQKQNLVRNVQASNFYDNERLAMQDLDGTGSNYSLLSSSMRLVNYKSNGSFAVDKRFSPFLHPYSRVGMGTQAIHKKHGIMGKCG